MAMPKKGSRSLMVDGQKYRWALKRTLNDTVWNHYGMGATLTVAVEDYENPQCMLYIRYPCGVEYGLLGFERPRSATTGEVMKVTPQQVSDMIRKALAQGWNPRAAGPKHCMTV